jgi:hypothetical protein
LTGCTAGVLCLFCSGGIGQIDHRHLEKADGEIGMLVVKIGGPAYRIGMGGGAASSVPSGSNKADLDFNAVQVCSHSVCASCLPSLCFLLLAYPVCGAEAAGTLRLSTADSARNLLIQQVALHV